MSFRIYKLVGYGLEEKKYPTRWKHRTRDGLMGRCSSLNGLLLKEENYADRYVILPMSSVETPPWINYPKFLAGCKTCATCGVVIDTECKSC